MKRILMFFLSLILLLGLRQNSNAMPANLTLLNNVNVSSSVDKTDIELKFDGKRQQERVLYHDDFVQIEFPDTFTTPPKQWYKVEDDIVKNIFVYQFDTTTVRVRLFSYDKAKNMKDRIRISKANNGFMIHYALGAAVGRDLPVASKKELKKGQAGKIKSEPPVEVDVPDTTSVASQSGNLASSTEGEGIINQAETGENRGLIKDEDKRPPIQGEGQSSETTLSGKLDKGDNKLDLANNTPAFTGSVVKMVTALGIVLSLLFGVVYLAKKFLGKKMGLSGQDQKIKVVTSTYLGPKKSIALVEVSGEKIVVGVTATHISMLTKIGKDDDFNDVLKEQIKSTEEKVELQDELWDKV